MNKMIFILGITLATPLYAWDGGPEDMNTMNDNMAGPIVRVVKSYPGMFRGWTDNNGFRHGGYVFKSHTHAKPKVKHKTKHKKKSHHHVKKFTKKQHVHQSGVCIAKCYCEH